MFYKNGERMRDFFGLFISCCSLLFYILGAFLIKTIIRLRLVNIGEYSPRLRLGEYSPLLKTGSLDNVIRQFSLA